LKVAAAGREAIASARRAHIGEVRAAVRTQIVESYRRRQELSDALTRLRRGLTEFRSQLRRRLHKRSPAGKLSTTPVQNVTVPAATVDTSTGKADVHDATAR
jgi:hypothetical protein